LINWSLFIKNLTLKKNDDAVRPNKKPIHTPIALSSVYKPKYTITGNPKIMYEKKHINDGIFTSWIPLKQPWAITCIPSKTWNTATTINSFEAILTVSIIAGESSLLKYNHGKNSDPKMKIIANAISIINTNKKNEIATLLRFK